MDVAEEKPDAKPTEEIKNILPYEVWLPHKHLLPIKFRSIAQQIQELPGLDDDVWIVAFPKSGTTWLQETVWLLTHGRDFETAKRIPLSSRSVFLEFASLEAANVFPEVSFENTSKLIEKMERPRVLKSHLFWDKLPKAARDPKSGAKIVYVARNPKDVFVSLFYFYRMTRNEKYHEVAKSMEFMSEIFLNDKIGFGPFWSHVLEYWNRRNDSNVLFLRFEDMKADMPGQLDKLQEFLGLPPLSHEDKVKLADHLSFEKMKNNEAVNAKNDNIFRKTYVGTDEESNFMREGKVGDWKDKLSPELVKRFDEWIARNTAETDYVL